MDGIKKGTDMKRTESAQSPLLMAIKMWELDAIPHDELHPREVVEQLVQRALDLVTPPRYHRAAHRVHEGGLSKPVYWRGRQWAVTSYGVECRERDYWIEKKRLWEDEESFGWVRHMAEKNWVDIADFAEALRIARMRTTKERRSHRQSADTVSGQP